MVIKQKYCGYIGSTIVLVKCCVLHGEPVEEGRGREGMVLVQAVRPVLGYQPSPSRVSPSPGPGQSDLI